MSISIQNYSIRGNVAAYSKAPKSKSAAEASASFEVKSTANTDKAADEDALIAFKKDFYQDLEQIKMHSTVKNAAINISDKAFVKMQADPQYREKVLSLLQRDLCASYAPRPASVILTVGETLEQYRGDAWPIGGDSDFFGRSQSSFYKKSNNDAEDDYEKKRMEAYEKMMWDRRYFEQQRQLKAEQIDRNQGKQLHFGYNPVIQEK